MRFVFACGSALREDVTMAEFDNDLQSIQEARTLATQAREAQRQFLHATQAEVDRICAAMAQAACDNALPLAQLAVQETTYGRVDHKVIKNQFGSRMVWDSLKDVKTLFGVK